MPIVDVQFVYNEATEASSISAQALADALGQVFGSAPGHTWVRVHALRRASYAENETELMASELPVFVAALHARPPVQEALALEALTVTKAVATCIGRPIERVHVQYAPAGVGRQAFGGSLVE